MRLAFAFAFDAFRVGWQFEGNLAAQVVIGLITVAVMLRLWKKYKHTWLK